MKNLEPIYNRLCVLDNSYRNIRAIVPQTERMSLEHVSLYQRDVSAFTDNLHYYNVTKSDLLEYVVGKMQHDSSKEAFDMYKVLQKEAYVKTFSDVMEDSALEARFREIYPSSFKLWTSLFAWLRCSPLSVLALSPVGIEAPLLTGANALPDLEIQWV